MPGESKDAKMFVAKKKYEAKEKITLGLSFGDSLFMMFILRKKITSTKEKCIAFDNSHHYNHSFEPVGFHKCLYDEFQSLDTFLLST